MVMLLKDMIDKSIDGIIISKTSTAEDINKAIADMKAKCENDYCWEDVVKAIPDDCEVVVDLQTVWY